MVTCTLELNHMHISILKNIIANNEIIFTFVAFYATIIIQTINQSKANETNN